MTRSNFSSFRPAVYRKNLAGLGMPVLRFRVKKEHHRKAQFIFLREERIVKSGEPKIREGTNATGT
jgi:hypothetical protein